MHQPLRSLRCTCEINVTLLMRSGELNREGEEEQHPSVHHPAKSCQKSGPDQKE